MLRIYPQAGPQAGLSASRPTAANPKRHIEITPVWRPSMPPNARTPEVCNYT